MGEWTDAFERITDGRRVEDMTPEQLAEAERKTQVELDQLVAEPGGAR